MTVFIPPFPCALQCGCDFALKIYRGPSRKAGEFMCKILKEYQKIQTPQLIKARVSF